MPLLAFLFLMAAQPPGAPVVLDGVELFRVHAPLGAYSAEERAKEAAARIEAAASRGAESVGSLPGEAADTVVSGATPLFAVSDQDARAEGATRRQLAEARAERVRNAISAWREARSWPRLAASALRVLLFWVLFAIAAYGLYWLFGYGERRLDAWRARLEKSRQVRGLIAVLAERLSATALSLARLLVAIALFIQFSALVTLSLAQFPATAGLSVPLLDWARHALAGLGAGILSFLPNLLVLVITALFAWYLLRLLRLLARAVERGDLRFSGFHGEWAQPTYALVRVLVVMFALVVSFPYLPGGNSDAFKGVSIFFGVLISLGSGSAVSSIVAGIILTYMRPFRAGDRVKVGEVFGDIIEKNLLVTRIRTIKNEEVTVPNSQVLSGAIVNYSAIAQSAGLILHSTVTIGYEAPWRKVHELLAEAAIATEGILREPAPFVLQTALNDFNVSYEINAYTDRPNDMVNVYARLHSNIQESFNRAGVEIMSPSYLALRDGNTATTPAAQRPAGYQAPGFRLNLPPR